MEQPATALTPECDSHMKAGSVRYGVIVADPPWQYANAGCRGAAENHYPTMTVQEIRALDIAALAADDCILFLWATWPTLIEATSVIEAWGFAYVTGLPWLKIVGAPSIDLWGDLRVKAQYGVGFWVRGCTEPLLIARRGKVSPPDGGFVGLLSENLRHSRKPENVYHIAEQLSGPYLELFARRPRAGWDSWGNEVGLSNRDAVDPVDRVSADRPRAGELFDV